MAGKNKVEQDALDQQPMDAAQDQPQKVDFTVWWVLNEKKIPVHHYKEIIQADFKGQGLSDMELMADFDVALKKYGLDI